MSRVRTQRLPRPTEAELAILQVMWTNGPCSVREVHEALQAESSVTGYTTTLKLMQLMHGKGLVIRDASQRAHVYAAAVGREETEQRFVGEMIERLFQGSASRLVLQALGASPPASRAEIAMIKDLVERLEDGGTR